MVCVTVSRAIEPAPKQELFTPVSEARMLAVERRLRELSDLPPAEVLINRIVALEAAVLPTNGTVASAKQVFATVNAHSADLLEVKTVLAELRTDVGKVRTRQSLGSVAGG